MDLLLPECSGEFGLSQLPFSLNVSLNVSLDGAISHPGKWEQEWGTSASFPRSP